MDSINVALIAMKSPGGREYRLSMEKTPANLALLKDKNNMQDYLSSLKQQGLQPQEGSSAFQVSSNFISSQSALQDLYYILE